MKLAAALAVPLLGLVVVTVLEVRGAGKVVRDVRAQAALAETSLGPSSVLSAIEEERNAAGVYLLGQEEGFTLEVEDNAEARGLTNDAIEAFSAEVDRQDDDVRAAYAPALEAMAGLDTLRADVDAAPDDRRNLFNIDAVSQNFQGYSDIMHTLARTNQQVALEIDDAQLRLGAELVDLNSQQTDLIATLVRDLLLAEVGGQSPNGLDTPEEVSTVARNLGQLRSNWDTMANSATGVYRPLVRDLVTADLVVRFQEVVDEAIATGHASIPDVMASSAGDDPETLAYSVFGDDVKEVVRERADDLTAAAEARQLWFIVLALVAIVLAVVVTLLVSMSITRPLRSLTRQAKDMAERRLPDAVIDILETPLGDDVQVPTVE
ncbi:MAG TPA: nitrate- and nitrite sensing domain-containing protein, partial [Acidimicrobiales bacterium]|nr:nitrate- and nitrite sensing domain-containing protein [Acidimicrobiales bacterium]